MHTTFLLDLICYSSESYFSDLWFFMFVARPKKCLEKRITEGGLVLILLMTFLLLSIVGSNLGETQLIRFSREEHANKREDRIRRWTSNVNIN